MANGYVPATSFLGTTTIDSCRLFINMGTGFVNRAPQLDISLVGPSRGAIYGDIDRDGDLDIVVANTIFGGSGRQRILFQNFGKPNRTGKQLFGY